MTSQKECPRCKVFSYYRAPTCLDCGFDFNGSKSQRLTIEYVKKFFADKGYTLLETEYKNTHAKMSYRCPKGHESKITFGHFQQGKRCGECNGSKRHTLKYVKKFFADKGYILLEKEYKNAHIAISYICPRGHKSKISFSSFQQGSRCAKCSHIRIANKIRKYTIEYVEKCFEDDGYTLLEREYKNTDVKISYRCPKGHEAKISFEKFQNGRRCAKCGHISTAEKLRKYSHEEVEKYFLENGYILLEKYVDTKTKIVCRCPEGHVSEIDFYNFRKGHRCAECNGNKKYTYEYVKKCFEDDGYTLLEREYKNNQTEMFYRCPKGHESKIKFGHFIQGHRCQKCSYKQSSETKQFYKNQEIDLDSFSKSLDRRLAELEN